VNAGEQVIVGSHLSKRDWFVGPAPINAARNFIRQHHYSKGCSKTAAYLHGLFRRTDTALMGVAQWIPPTRDAAETVNRESWQQVLALSRLCIHPDVPTNGASFLMARSIRLIQQEGRFVSLVTYADEWQGHTGAIYRATNWTYVGMTAPEATFVLEGRMIARKAGGKTRTRAEMAELGADMIGRFAKHKFVMHLTPARITANEVHPDLFGEAA
jgi:hypothetical protein